MYNAQCTKDRIKNICKVKKVNMEQMLVDCSLGVNAIRQINDTKGMASFSLAKIADYLDCSVDYLLGRTDSPTVSGNNIIQSSNVINGNNGNHSPLTVTETEKENNCKEIEALLEKMPRSKQLRAIADIIDLLEEKYQEE